jgi:2-oxoglutarate ferredoxin oxidoreductase subunit alpha
MSLHQPNESLSPAPKKSHGAKSVKELHSAVIRFAGDSGDGMQLVGDQFTNTCAVAGDYFATLPDYPSEIRAPAGTVFGVSGYQICIGGSEVFTPGDRYDVLFAMNPAALKVNIASVCDGGIVIVNEDAFNAKNLEKAGYVANPLEDAAMKAYRLVRVPMSSLTAKTLEGLPMTSREADRCKNFFALGIVYWLFGCNASYSLGWMKRKFAAKPQILEANERAYSAGHEYAACTEQLPHSFALRKEGKARKPGVYRNVTGNQAAALGLIAAARKSGLELFLGSYPITPATDIMQELTRHRDFAKVFQAEDEIAAIGAAIGAAFGGALAATTTSGPGFSLKSEFMNLAVMTELPLVIIDVQRAGPSTGLPTKTEQSDMFQAMWGRHGESPIVVMAATTPKDCFDISIEASRIAVKYMTPVVVLSEGYLGNGSEVWRIPGLDEIAPIPVKFRTEPEGFLPYERNLETLARPWAIPGTPGLEHRIGGLEKEDRTGTVSHNPANHEKMVKLRAEKVARVAQEYAPMEVFGHPEAELLVLGWGGTAGVIKAAVSKLSGEGLKVACAQLRYLNPFPNDLEGLMKRYKKVLIPENNTGHLWYRIRAEYLLDTERLNKIQGQPFRIDEIESKIRSILGA